MILIRFFDISTGFRFSKISVECSIHSCSCPWTMTMTGKIRYMPPPLIWSFCKWKKELYLAKSWQPARIFLVSTSPIIGYILACNSCQIWFISRSISCKVRSVFGLMAIAEAGRSVEAVLQGVDFDGVVFDDFFGIVGGLLKWINKKHVRNTYCGSVYILARPCRQ